MCVSVADWASDGRVAGQQLGTVLGWDIGKDVEPHSSETIILTSNFPSYYFNCIKSRTTSAASTLALNPLFCFPSMCTLQS
jgi:hypothetical protein